MNGSLNLANHHDDSGHNGIGLLDPIGSSSLKNPFTTSGTVETVEGVKEVSKSNPRRVGFKRGTIFIEEDDDLTTGKCLICVFQATMTEKL